MKTKVLISLYIALWLFGCKSPTEVTQSQASFSLQKTWVYSYQTFDTNGNSGTIIYDTIHVMSSNIISGKKNYFLTDSTTIIVDTNNFMTGYEQSNCLCFTDKFPAIAGDTITRDSVPTKVNGNVGLGIFILFCRNADTTITVPAGTFQCAIYELKIYVNNVSTGSLNISYISPTVGLVESDRYNTDDVTGKIYLSSRKQLIKTVK